MSEHKVVYQLRLPPDHPAVPYGYKADETLVGEFFMVFDTRFCMPGHPYAFVEEGYVFVADGSLTRVEQDGTVILGYLQTDDHGMAALTGEET